MPLASFVMTAYNSAAFIEKSINSVLNQSVSDLELIVIDDCSSDQTPQIISGFKDPRIRYHRNTQNLHIAAAANTGLKMADSKYILRIDSDDICVPDRLQYQLAFMEKHPETGVCGSFVRNTGLENNVWKMPLSDPEIKAYMIFNNPLANSSVIIRRSILQENALMYRADFSYPPMEDYDLWFRLIDKTAFANIDRVLVHRHIGANSQSLLHKDKRKQGLKKLFEIHLNDLFSELDEDEKACFINLSIQEFNGISDEQTGLYLRVLQKAYEILVCRSYISAEAFKKRCRIKMMRMMMHARPEQWHKFSEEWKFFGGRRLYLKYLLRRLRWRQMG